MSSFYFFVSQVTTFFGGKGREGKGRGAERKGKSKQTRPKETEQVVGRIARRPDQKEKKETGLINHEWRKR